MSDQYSHYADMSYTYDPNAAQQFQNYDHFQDYNQFQEYNYDTNTYPNPTIDNNVYPTATGDMQTGPGGSNDSSDPYANEPPLMEELEINLDQIRQKTWAVLTFKNLNDHKNILHDPDLAGPLVFLMTFGFLLLLTGKIQFGYIYGLGTMGCLIIYFVVYLLAAKNISFMCTVSVLGYCLLPMVMLSGLSILINLKATIMGNVISIVAILWCAVGASNLLVTAIEMSNSRLIIAYPCALFYTVFALLTVF